MMETKKIIASGVYWICENMDTLAPIIEEGVQYLFDDGTTELVKNGDELSQEYEYATIEEKKAYASAQYGTIFKGDTVVIKRGRKMKGEIKEVRGYYRYDVPGTYGHQYTEYLLFTDGTKVNINHCDVLGVDHHDEPSYNGVTYYFRFYREKLDMSTFAVGGRL